MYQAEAKARRSVMPFVYCGQPCDIEGWDWGFVECLDGENKQ